GVGPNRGAGTARAEVGALLDIGKPVSRRSDRVADAIAYGLERIVAIIADGVDQLLDLLQHGTQLVCQSRTGGGGALHHLDSPQAQDPCDVAAARLDAVSPLRETTGASHAQRGYVALYSSEYQQHADDDGQQ